MMIHSKDISNEALDERLRGVETKVNETFTWVKRIFYLLGAILTPIVSGFGLALGKKLFDLLS